MAKAGRVQTRLATPMCHPAVFEDGRTATRKRNANNAVALLVCYCLLVVWWCGGLSMARKRSGIHRARDRHMT